MMTSHSPDWISRLATLRLLVTTRRLRCRHRARATSSVVVPMVRNSDAPSGMRAATARAMRRLASDWSTWRAE